MYDELETTTKALYESHRKRMKLSGALLVPWDKLTVHNQAHWRGVAKHALDQTRTVTAPLNKLRVSLARIGQNAALDIPGCNFKTANFTELSRAAQDEERGWNGLAAGISDAIELLQREVEGLQQRNRELDNENVRIERENSDLRGRGRRTHRRTRSRRARKIDMMNYTVRCSEARETGAIGSFGIVSETIQASDPDQAEADFRERFETKSLPIVFLQTPPTVRMIEVTYRGATNRTGSRWIVKLVGSGKRKTVPYDHRWSSSTGATQAAAEALDDGWELDSMCSIDGGGYIFACRWVG